MEELCFIKDRYPTLGRPLIRGTMNFLDAMVSGAKALMCAASFYPEEAAIQQPKFDLWLERRLSNKKLRIL